MCTAAATTAANLMTAIRPTIVSLLNLTNLSTTPGGIAGLKAFDAIVVALQGWKSGTTAQNILQLIGDFQVIFNALPIPAGIQVLANIILAGIETVIGVLTANSPAPPAPAGSTVAAADLQAFHQAHVAAETAAKVEALVPGFKRSIFHSVESQYTTAWNKACDAGGWTAEKV
jgi:hypothetical protein